MKLSFFSKNFLSPRFFQTIKDKNYGQNSIFYKNLHFSIWLGPPSPLIQCWLKITWFQACRRHSEPPTLILGVRGHFQPRILANNFCLWLSQFFKKKRKDIPLYLDQKNWNNSLILPHHSPSTLSAFTMFMNKLPFWTIVTKSSGPIRSSISYSQWNCKQKCPGIKVHAWWNNCEIAKLLEILY